MNAPTFDPTAAHRFFSAECFNRAWDFIDKPDRTADEDQQMLLSSMASLWHWTQRDDSTEENLSIGYWQISRVYAILGQAASAEHFGDLCLNHSGSLRPFFRAYAHEALARAALAAGDASKTADHLEEARTLMAQVSDPEERSALEKDLGTIR